jgi:extracellular factor (EF) 3-hydroxypalmitic acid methyl ester biosynthesis protein
MNSSTTVTQQSEKRTYVRKTWENVFCMIDDIDPPFEVVEVSAHGFSFACGKDDKRFRPSVLLDDISIINGESQEIIHARGIVRHRSDFDAETDRIGVSFESKRYDKTVTGRVRLPRRKPSIELVVSLRSPQSAITGTVVDLNVRSVRLDSAELPALASAGTPGLDEGDTVHVTMGAGEDHPQLYDGAGRILRRHNGSSEIVVEFVDGLLDLRLVTVSEKAHHAREIIENQNEKLDAYQTVREDFRVLVADWRMYFEMVEEVVSREEAKNLLRSEHEERFYLDEIMPGFFAATRSFIERLNTIAPLIPAEDVAVHKELMRTRVGPFIHRSPLASSIMDKVHGYSGDFETVKHFFSSPHAGSTMFGKLMNHFIMSLEPVRAHIRRIGMLYEEILAQSRMSPEGIRILSLGSGPAEEVLRLMQTADVPGPIHATLVDVDSHALADFHERAQHFDNPLVTADLVNFNVIDVLVGKSVDLPAESFDLTYCAGMYDYFKDRFCRKYTQFLIDLTAPGGAFLYTNVHSRNFARYIMDYGCGWEIYHRDEEQTRALTPEGHETAAYTDETGTNVFVKGVKRASA